MKRLQQGDGLMEAIIGILLIGIMALGLIYTTTQAERAHRDTKINGLVVAQMRDMLQRNRINYPYNDIESDDLPLLEQCDASGTKEIGSALYISASSTPAKLYITCTDNNISVNGTTTTGLKKITLSTDSDPDSSDYKMFGGELQVGN